MGESTDRRDALAFLAALEGGGVDAARARALGERLDPVLVHLLVRYLREVYPPAEPAASAVLERVVALTRAWPGMVAVAKQGEADPVSAWFVSEHGFREFRGRGEALVDVVVGKLEG